MLGTQIKVLSRFHILYFADEFASTCFVAVFTGPRFGTSASASIASPAIVASDSVAGVCKNEAVYIYKYFTNADYTEYCDLL